MERPQIYQFRIKNISEHQTFFNLKITVLAVATTNIQKFQIQQV
jgi:hypothetical protein